MTTRVLGPKAIMSAGTVAAIIRKDLRALWPFALTLALVQLMAAAFFHVRGDYPEVVLDIGKSQLHLGATWFVFQVFGLPIVVATFIVLLVHRDPANDARNDWMTRPIWALDIVAAKSLVILAVVLVPSAIGSFAYVSTHDNASIDVVTGPIILTLAGCIFMLVVAWLASSPVQALLAPLVLAVVALVTVLTLGVTVGLGVIDTRGRESRPVEIPAPARDAPAPPAAVPPPPAVAPPLPTLPGRTGAAPSPAAPSPQPTTVPEGAERSVEVLQGRRLELGRDRMESAIFYGGPPGDATQRLQDTRRSTAIWLSWALLISELLLELAAAGVVLWLLLARRRLLAARLTFLGFFIAATLLFMLGSTVVGPTDGFVSIARAAPVRPPAPEPQRLAAFANNDTNKDGRLDRTEYNALLDELGFSGQLETLWPQRDRDRDGFVSIEEYKDPL